MNGAFVKWSPRLAPPPLIFLRRRLTYKIIQAPTVNYPGLLSAGVALIEGGVNLIPVNDHKTPADPPLPHQRWKKYQTERVTETLLRKWANTPGVCGWAMVGGKISGGLVVQDLDVPGFFERFIETIKRNKEVRELIVSVSPYFSATTKARLGLALWTRPAAAEGAH